MFCPLLGVVEECNGETTGFLMLPRSLGFISLNGTNADPGAPGVLIADAGSDLRGRPGPLRLGKLVNFYQHSKESVDLVNVLRK